MKTGSTYLIITPLTPSAMLSPLRKELFELYLEALKKQEYPHWSALLIGEEDKTDGNIRYVKAPASGVTKFHKLVFAADYIRALPEKPNYVIRLDDDDLISANLLQSLSGFEFDCFADKKHTFYDILSGQIAQQDRNWLANTVVHKTEHALSFFGSEQYPLLASDHSTTWLQYYKDKVIKYTSPEKPVYLRILSPTSITAGGAKEGVNHSGSEAYQKYLGQFGKWKHRKELKGLDIYFNDLKKIRKKYFENISRTKKSLFQRLFR